MKKLLPSAIPLGISLLGIAGAILLTYSESKLAEPWLRACLQVGVVGVFGFVVSAVLERHKDDLQRARSTAKLRFDALTSLSRTYMDVKLIRRQMQAASEFDTTQVDELNVLQTQIELHKRTSIYVFEDSEALKAELKSMEKYLNHVANDADSADRDGFLGRGFYEFADAYGAAVKLITAEIAA